MLSQFRHILIPLDFSEKNQAAFEVAFELAVTNEARVTLLHVIETIDLPDDFRFTYDFLGRLDTVEVHERNDVVVDADPGMAGNQPETTDYDYNLLGNLDEMTTPDGVITDYIYDVLNRLDIPGSAC